MNARLLFPLPLLLLFVAADAPKKDAEKGKGGAADAKQEAVEKDNKALRGIWEVVGQQRGGAEIPKKFAISALFEFAAGEKFRIVVGKATPGALEGYRIDPTKNPKHLDIKFFDEWAPAIYKLDGETLTIVWAAVGDMVRPDEFKTKPRDGRTLFRLKRLAN